jgi:hypothetical protein
MVVVVLQQADDPLRVLLGFGGRGQGLEPRRQHLFPVDPDLPGPRLVCEEDDVFPTLVDAVQEAEDDVECLTDLGPTVASSMSASLAAGSSFECLPFLPAAGLVVRVMASLFRSGVSAGERLGSGRHLGVHPDALSVRDCGRDHSRTSRSRAEPGPVQARSPIGSTTARRHNRTQPPLRSRRGRSMTHG